MSDRMNPYPIGWWRDHLPEEAWPLYEDFAFFAGEVWQHLGLPRLTPAQVRICAYLQANDGELPVHGRASQVQAFRGIGKSFITAAFVLWRLFRDPYNEKILVVSATGAKAKDFVRQCKGLVEGMPLLAHLRPGEGDLNQVDRFDVAGHSLSQSPSVVAKGVSGQITGSRATLIVADDVETQESAGTEEAREKLLGKINEFDAIVVPAEFDEQGNCTQRKGDVIFLGTPQSLESIYHRMIKERGFDCLCIPARVPKADAMVENYTVERDDGSYADILDPWIRDQVKEGKLHNWDPVDPGRFSEDDLQSRESRGRSFFTLQYMLDTSLSDADRYPLKQNDLIVMDTNSIKAPMVVQWGLDSDRKNLIGDIPNLGFTGDRLLRPLFVDAEWREYERSVCFVDPSGRGKDEFAWTIAKSRGDTIYVLENKGHLGDVEAGLKLAAKDCATHDVSKMVIEPNFGSGTVIALARNILRTHSASTGCEESAWATNQKEARIIDTMEPVLNGHRLVVDTSVLRRDAAIESSNRGYSLLYQLTHLTRDRGSLRHDDRLDSLAGAVEYLGSAIAKDRDDERRAQMDLEEDEMLQDFIESITAGPMGRRGKVRGKKMEDAFSYQG